MSYSPHTLGIIIGGLLPALMFGISNVLVKASEEHGISIALYVFVVGVATIICSVVLFFIFPGKQISATSGMYAFLAGSAWVVGITGVFVALQRFGTPLGVLVPLYNMNTLVAVLLALWFFAEWKEVHTSSLVLGASLITLGAILVAKA